MPLLEKLAPRRLAEEWDNVGLQFGNPDSTIDHIFIALDPTFAAIHAAAAAGAGMLVTHHPLIFKPLKTIDLTSPLGKILDFAAKHCISIFSAHTNLDSVSGGVNDALAEAIGLISRGPLTPAPASKVCKLVLFVPVAHAGRILKALVQTPAGVIGDYSACSFYQEGMGRFIPGPSASPHTGTPGKLTETSEIRIETRVNASELHAVIERVRRDHPYETMAYDVYPLQNEPGSNGIGRVGRFERVRPLSAVASDIGTRLGLKSVKFAGAPDLQVETAAICSGGGSGLIADFLASGAQVYISGDLNHHAAIDIAAMGRGMIDIGHFASERLIVPVLGHHLRAGLEKAGMIAKVTPWKDEPDPFTYIRPGDANENLTGNRME